MDYGDGQTQGYTFDAMGNRLGKTDSVAGSTGYTVDAANRLLTAGANTYTSDADGNTLTDGTRTNVWDSQNRLASCTSGGVTSTYTYGADGLRRTSTVNGVTTYYVYDGTMMVREMRQNAQRVLQSTATYLCGPRGPEYRRDDTQAEGTYTDSTGTHPAGKTRWYVYDGLGSVVGEVDPSGNLTSTGTFDVYGAKRQGGTGAATSRQGFVGALGHVSDSETGLVYMRARYYDPSTGRFVSEDPAKHGMNWFAYCHNNPVSYFDPSGKDETLGELGAGMEGASEGDALDGGPPSQLLYATEHGAEEFYNWFVEKFASSGSVHNLDDALEAWDAQTAQLSDSGSWMCKVTLYNERLILIAEDDAEGGQWSGIGRLVTAY